VTLFSYPSARPPARTRHRTALRTLLPLAAAVGLFAFNASAAQAVYTHSFCEGVYLDAGEKCMDNYQLYLQQVKGKFSPSNTVRVCAGAKQYSDGSGSNVIDFACGYGEVYTASYSCCSRLGWSAVKSGSPNPHDGFSGRAFWY
jgi:hypothetical protein